MNVTFRVLDSWALIAFFENEPAAVAVERILQQAVKGSHELLLSVINWGEVYYSIMRADSPAAAERCARAIAAMPITIVGVSDDLTLVKEAALLKGARRMSFADCFAAALAKAYDAELVTGDREFRAVEGTVKIHWLQ